MPAIKEVDVLIIGAGVIGASVARELSRYDLQVMVIEKEVDVSFGTSKANSGIVHSGIHDRPGTLKAGLSVAGNRLFPELAGDLQVLYKQNGAILVARNREELTSLEELSVNGKKNGISRITPLSGDELLSLEPNLAADLAGGILVPSGGIIVPFDLVFALIENALANGVLLAVNTKASKIALDPAGFLVETNRGLIKSDFIVNAAGLYGAEVARMIGDESLGIYPRKGEEFLLDRRLEGLVKRTIFPVPSEVSKGILIIPTVDGNIMIGPNAYRVDSPNDLGTTSAGWNEIYSETKRLLPALKPADIITSFAGLRAANISNDFIIGPSLISRRFINAAGIESPGLTAAPAIGQYLVELLKENSLKLKLRPKFNPQREITRLRQLTREQQGKLMFSDPAYANIVCRCELVSEAEIRGAIRRGATTTDGIKLRTRCGMGRCQGGFCTARVIRILQEELGIGPADITKKGPGSSLFAGYLRGSRSSREEGVVKNA